MSLKNKFKTSLLVSVCVLSNFVFAADTMKNSTPNLKQVLPIATETEKRMSFWDLPYLEHAYMSTKPENRSDGIVVGDLSHVTKNHQSIINLSNEFQSGKYGLYDSLLISHKNKLVFESYYRRSRVNLAAGQASATKTYTSLILGSAIEQGFLTLDDIHKPLINLISDLKNTDLVSGAETITLHKALTMRGGIKIDSDRRKEFEKHPEQLNGSNYIKTLLVNSAPITETSQQYAYGNFNDTLVMHVLDAVIPGGVENFIKTQLLDKLEINNYQWRNSISGVPEAGWRVSFTSRDMLKWGSLLMNDGKWQGEQLISKAYLDTATSAITDPTDSWIPAPFMYGYFIYQTDILINDESFSVNFAWGGGGQYVISVKPLDLVIVIKGHEREDDILFEALNKIIPAFL